MPAITPELHRAIHERYARLKNQVHVARELGIDRMTVAKYLVKPLEDAATQQPRPAPAPPIQIQPDIQATPNFPPEFMQALQAAMQQYGMIGQGQQVPMPSDPVLAPNHYPTRPEFIGSETVTLRPGQDVYKVLVSPDAQLPYEDRKAMNAVERYAADNDFDEWIDLGDFLDLDFLSRFNINNHRANAGKFLKEHYAYGREVLDRRLRILRGNNPQAKFTLIEGNHDFRVESYINEHPSLEGILEVEEGLELRQKRIQWIRNWRDKTLYRVGKALFSHGLYTNQYHAAKMVNAYCENVFYGHVHDVMCFPKVMHGRDKVVVGQSLGCLCRHDQIYIQNNPRNWQQALGVFYFFPDGKFNYFVPRIFDGKFIAPDGKVYEGRE